MIGILSVNVNRRNNSEVSKNIKKTFSNAQYHYMKIV